MSSATAHSSRRADRALIFVEALVGLGVVAAVVGKSYGAASTVTFILTGLALAFTVVVAARMFTALKDETLDVPGRMHDLAREELEHEKLILLQGIKEFEADAAQGKVDTEDYESLRRTAEARAVEILRTLQDSDAQYMQRAEELIRKRTGGKKVSTVAPPKDAPAAPPPAASADSGSKTIRFIESNDRLVCSQCGGENEADGRFCVGCGKLRAEATA